MKAIAIVSLALLLIIPVSASAPFTGIVASTSFTGQTSDLSNQVIYTPDTNGIFRVSVCEENASHIGGVSDTVSWTDVFSSSQSHTGTFNGANPVCDQVTFRDKANSSVTLSTGGISGLGSPVSMYVIVERLQ